MSDPIVSSGLDRVQGIIGAGDNLAKAYGEKTCGFVCALGECQVLACPVNTWKAVRAYLASSDSSVPVALEIGLFRGADGSLEARSLSSKRG